MFASVNSHFMSGLFSGESMCCHNNTKRQLSSTLNHQTDQEDAGAADPRSAHVVKSRGEGSGAGNEAPSGGGVGRGGDLEGDQMISFGGNGGGRRQGRRRRGGLTGDGARRWAAASDAEEEARPRRRRAARRPAGVSMVASPGRGGDGSGWWWGFSACGRLAKPARLEKKRPISLCASLRHERYGLDGPDPAFRSSCYLGLKFTGRVVRFYKLLNRSCLVRNVKVRPRNS